jgi:hypothetical protein
MTDTFNPACLLNHTLAHAPPLAAGPATAIDRAGEAATAGPPVFGVTTRFVQNCTLRRRTSDHPFSVSVSHVACL